MTVTLAVRAAPEVAAPVEVPPVLDFAARLALRDAEMAGRCRMAVTALDVTAAEPEMTVNLADVITGPVEVPTAPVDLYPTPVAALLQRAHARITDGGWCSGYAVDGQGAVCLAWAIHLAARGDVGLEVAGLNHLLDQIRADFGDWDSVPSWNDAQTGSATPIRILGAAAETAHQCGT